LFGGNEGDVFPVATLWLDNLVLWPSDLAHTVKQEFVAALAPQGADRFEDVRTRASKMCGDAGELEKNAVYLGNLLTLLKEAGATSGSLDRLCDRIIAFGSGGATKSEPAATSEPSLFP
jgi:hypothetical protein